MRRLASAVLALALLSGGLNGAERLGSHDALYEKDGSLKPWSSWDDVLQRELAWYQKCPKDHGYPLFFSVTFLDGAFAPLGARDDTIPATQNGLGILSYLAAHRRYDQDGHQFLDTAAAMGDYLLKEALTPEDGSYPRFPRSTGHRGQFPLKPDCGSQDDQPFEIQPDKGALAAFAWWRLHLETGRKDFGVAALHVARVLASHQRSGDARHSPWPFRADWRTGEARGGVSGNMVFALRLYDGLLEAGYGEFEKPRAELWAWIKRIQIPDAQREGLLWAQFFEDHHNPSNRTAWAPLNLARYLLEKKETLSPEWKEESKLLIEFVNRNFVRVRFGVAVCGEQDEDLEPWGGITSTYGAVLALYCRETGSTEYLKTARQALTLCLYATDADGCPRDSLLHDERGGWQEDAHTDKVHNLISALESFPAWAE